MRSFIAAADRADRLHDMMLARALAPPPQKRKTRPSVATAGRAKSEGFDKNSIPTLNDTDCTVQRALQAAHRRVVSLEHRVQVLHQLRQRDAPLRLAAVAAGIRAEVLA